VKIGDFARFLRKGYTILTLALVAVAISLPLAGMSLALGKSQGLASALLTKSGPDLPFQAVYVDNGTVYGGTEGGVGVYRSTDNGASWAEWGDDLGKNDVLSLVRRDDDILAGTWGEGVYRRAVGGSRWYALNDGIDQEGEAQYDSIRAMVVGAGGSPDTYAADPDRVVYRLPWESTNWQTLSSNGLPTPSQEEGTQYDIICLFLDGSTLYAGLVDAGVYEYTGSAWTAKGNLGGRSGQALDYGPDGALWVGTSNGVYRWSGGWVLVSGTSGWDVKAIKRNPQDTDELVVGLYSGEVYCYRQTTGKWHQISLGIPSGMRVWSIAFGANERLFIGVGDTDPAVVDGGLYYADNACPTATPTNTPTATPTPVPDLSLALTNDPPASVPVAGGDYITYTIHYQNVSGSNLANVQVWCYIPADNVAYDTADGTGQFGSGPLGDRVLWDLGTVEAGDSSDLWFRVQVEPIPPTPTPTPTVTLTPSLTQ